MVVCNDMAFIIYKKTAALPQWLVILVEGFYKNNAGLYFFNEFDKFLICFCRKRKSQK